jgi:hypothetical protein
VIRVFGKLQEEGMQLRERYICITYVEVLKRASG